MNHSELARGQSVFTLPVLMINAMKCKMMCRDGQTNEEEQAMYRDMAEELIEAVPFFFLAHLLNTVRAHEC